MDVLFGIINGIINVIAWMAGALTNIVGWTTDNLVLVVILAVCIVVVVFFIQRRGD